MHTSTFIASAAAFAGLASAASPSATIVIQASHGGAGSGLTNNTISVPIGPVYTNSQALSAVSTLYLTGASGVPVESISCTPYQAANGTGSHGLPFSSSTPSYLSTNTVQVGSIVCLSSSNGTSPTSGSNGTATGGGNSSANATSTLLVTPTPTTIPSSTSTPPGTSGAMSAIVPYYMSALFFGAAGLMFTL